MNFGSFKQLVESDPILRKFAMFRKIEDYKFRMSGASPEFIESVGTELLFHCVCTIQKVADRYRGKPYLESMINLFTAFKIISVEMAECSKGIQDGYRLHNDWLGIAITQLLYKGVSDGDDLASNGVKGIQKLLGKVGFDLEVCNNPKHSKLFTIHNWEFPTGVESTDFFKIVAVPYCAIPIGSIWESSVGKLYEVLEVKNYDVESEEFEGIYFEPQLPNARGIFTQVYITEHQFEKWKRIS